MDKKYLPDEYLTLKEAASIIGLKSIYHLVYSGKLIRYRVGSLPCVKKIDVDNYLKPQEIILKNLK